MEPEKMGFTVIIDHKKVEKINKLPLVYSQAFGYYLGS